MRRIFDWRTISTSIFRIFAASFSPMLTIMSDRKVLCYNAGQFSYFCTPQPISPPQNFCWSWGCGRMCGVSDVSLGVSLQSHAYTHTPSHTHPHPNYFFHKANYRNSRSRCASVDFTGDRKTKSTQNMNTSFNCSVLDALWK